MKRPNINLQSAAELHAGTADALFFCMVDCRLELLLETLDIPYRRLEGPGDERNIRAAWQASRKRKGHVVLIAGHFIGFPQPQDAIMTHEAA